MAPIGVAPVGAGKTRMAGMVAWDRWQKGQADFWHLAHRRELIERPLADFIKWGMPATRVLAGESPDPTSPIHVGSVDTLVNRNIVPCRPLCVLSIDEAHRAVGPRYMSLIEQFRAAYGRDRVRLVLWTATPYRLDGRPLGDVADDLHEIITPRELIDRGIIMRPDTVGASEPEAASGEVPESLAERCNTPRLVGDIVNTWIRYSEGAPTIGFACGIAHSEHLVERFLAAGIRAAHIDHTTHPVERARVLARLAIGGMGSDHPQALDIVWNNDLLREGWDSESDYRLVLEVFRDLWRGRSYPPEYVPLEVLVDAAPSDSCCLVQQRIGRVCRAHPKKRRALVISHSGNWRRHPLLENHTGFSLDRGWNGPRTRQDGSRGGAPCQAKHCPTCLAVWPPTTISCGQCGTSLASSPEIPEEDASVELVPIDTSEQPYVAPPDPEAERGHLRNLWAMWLRDNARRVADGRAPRREGWVAVCFQARWGRYPARQVSLDARRSAEGCSGEGGRR